MAHRTREGWLVAGVKMLADKFFKSAGYELPGKLQVSCGFPRASKDAIGQCWNPKTSGDGTTQMFVCPTQGNPVAVLATLLHEMIHASVGTEVGHKGIFKKLVKEFGLAGRMTTTFVEEGSATHEILERMVAKLGEYPHAPMTPANKPRSRRTKWLRFHSKTWSDYRVVIHPKNVDKIGVPKDPDGDDMLPGWPS